MKNLVRNFVFKIEMYQSMKSLLLIIRKGYSKNKDNHDTIYVMAEEIAGSLSELKKTVVSFSIVRLKVLFAVRFQTNAR